jgi:hypothetical protein
MLMSAHVAGTLRIAALTLILSGAGTVQAAAQAPAPPRDFHSGMAWGIGYSGTIPEAYFGAGGWHLLRGNRFGVFADGKVTLPTFTAHDNYCPPSLQECSITWVQQNRNDFDLRDENEWLIFNVGGLYAFYPEFALMLGGGMARLRRVREYVDPEEDPDIRITPEGNYFVPHFAEPSWTAQAVVGLLMRAGNRLAFSFGYETAPRGMTIGVFIIP